MLAGIDTATRARRSRLADLETAARRLPVQHERWERLRELVDRSFREAEMTRGLYSRSLTDRLRVLLALGRAGAYRDVLPQHAFLAVAPRLYLRYRRLRLGLSARESSLPARGVAP